MAHPERQPIYQSFEKIAQEIVSKKMYREYAESELKELIAEISRALSSISNRLVSEKFGESSKS